MTIQALYANTPLLKTVKTDSESVVTQEKTNIWSVEQEKGKALTQGSTPEIQEEDLTFGEKLKNLWDKPAVKIAVAVLSTVAVGSLAAKGIKAAKSSKVTKPQTFGDAKRSIKKRFDITDVVESSPGKRTCLDGDYNVIDISYDPGSGNIGNRKTVFSMKGSYDNDYSLERVTRHIGGKYHLGDYIVRHRGDFCSHSKFKFISG